MPPASRAAKISITSSHTISVTTPGSFPCVYNAFGLVVTPLVARPSCRATRVLIFKDDGSFLVHDDPGGLATRFLVARCEALDGSRVAATLPEDDEIGQCGQDGQQDGSGPESARNSV